METSSSSRRNLKIALVFGVAVGLVVAWRLGVLERLRDSDRLVQSILELGAWGYLAFVLSYAALQPFGVPGTIFVVAASLIWPWPIAFALSMIGTMAASVIGFSFARFIARDWLEPRIPARFRKYDDALAKRAFLTVVILRFLFWMPQVLHIFFGVSKVKGWTHFWGSLVGYVIPLFLVSYFGQPMLNWMRNAPPSAYAAFAGVALTIGLGWYLISRRRTRLEKQQGQVAE